MTMTATVQTTAPPEAVRRIPCPLCLAAAGLRCQLAPAGDHLARWLAAYSAGRITRDELGAVIRGLVVVTKWVVVPEVTR